MTPRSDLPLVIEFGLKLRDIGLLFAFWTVLLGLYFRDYAEFTRLDFAIGVFLTCAVLALAVWILLIYFRSYGRGKLNFSRDRIVVDGSRRQDRDYVRDCSGFALSKTKQEISWDVAIGARKVRRSVGGLKCSRAALVDLVTLLNTLAVELRGEALPDAPSIEPIPAQPIPSRFRGKRLGREGAYRYAVHTILITSAVCFGSIFIFVWLLMVSAPWNCSEPQTKLCLVVSALLSKIFLTLLWLVPLAVLLWRRHRGVASRLRDLDELPTVGAVLVAMIPFTPSRTRIVFEYGTPGPNRFGPAPE